ncbi:hypothetical protein F4781DRAFT_46542 [Annulohypoxylon bovei var. microspora]|nr:hypothetical protein F4781DRAFT_46542 [Annulohypoxylon bovei var. microspora]
MVSSTTYQTIQNWISRQQEYESTHSEPAPLTDAQRKLLEKLEIVLPPETPPQPEPELGDPNSNWIGVLLEYRAARQRVTSGVPGGNFMEEQGPTIGGELKWYCRVRIDEHPEPFPGPDGGLLDGKQPYFGRKKDAKKYAAKCAVEWLKANGYMFRSEANSVNPLPPQASKQQVTPQSSPAKKKPKLLPSSPENPGVTTVISEPNGAQPLPGSPLPKGIASTFNNEEVSAVFEVDQLCTRLGFSGWPRYTVTKSSEMNDFYNGHAELGLLASKLPIGIGRVENVFGKKAAKERIAEELLEYLRKLAAEHDEADQRFLASIAPKKEEVSVPA